MWSRIKKFFQSGFLPVPPASTPANNSNYYVTNPNSWPGFNSHANRRKNSVRHIPGDIKPNHVHLFTLNELEVLIPPTGVFRNGMKIPGRAADEPYRFVASFPEYFRVIDDWTTAVSDEVVYQLTSGVRAVVDLINPDLLKTSLDVDKWPITNSGRNFALRGIFYSLSNPPAQEEVDAATRRLTAYCQDLIVKANIAAFDVGMNLPELKLARKHFPTL